MWKRILSNSYVSKLQYEKRTASNCRTLLLFHQNLMKSDLSLCIIYNSAILNMTKLLIFTC